MMRDRIGRAASMAQLVSAALLALVGVRFGAHGVVFAMKAHAPSIQTGSSPTPKPPPATKPSGAPSASASASPGVKLGATLRIPIVVSSKAERAEVRIDGVLVGNTPYVGEVTCKAGEKVSIDVTPSKGPSKSHEGTCALGTLRVSD